VVSQLRIHFHAEKPINGADMKAFKRRKRYMNKTFESVDASSKPSSLIRVMLHSSLLPIT
jgi:hypothetical protein